MQQRNGCIQAFAVTGTLLLAVSMAPVWAQDTQQSDTLQNQQNPQDQKIEPELDAERRICDMTVENIIGLDVNNVHHQNIGDIEKLAIGPDMQLYAIIPVGGFLGLGEERVAIPFNEFELDPENAEATRVTSTVTKDSLKQQAAIYNPELYQPLDDEKLVSHFIGKEQKPMCEGSNA